MAKPTIMIACAAAGAVLGAALASGIYVAHALNRPSAAVPATRAALYRAIIDEVCVAPHAVVKAAEALQWPARVVGKAQAPVYLGYDYEGVVSAVLVDPSPDKAVKFDEIDLFVADTGCVASLKKAGIRD